VKETGSTNSYTQPVQICPEAALSAAAGGQNRNKPLIHKLYQIGKELPQGETVISGINLVGKNSCEHLMLRADLGWLCAGEEKLQAT